MKTYIKNICVCSGRVTWACRIEDMQGQPVRPADTSRFRPNMTHNMTKPISVPTLWRHKTKKPDLLGDSRRAHQDVHEEQDGRNLKKSRSINGAADGARKTHKDSSSGQALLMLRKICVQSRSKTGYLSVYLSILYLSIDLSICNLCISRQLIKVISNPVHAAQPRATQ